MVGPDIENDSILFDAFHHIGYKSQQAIVFECHPQVSDVFNGVVPLFSRLFHHLQEQPAAVTGSGVNLDRTPPRHDPGFYRFPGLAPWCGTTFARLDFRGSWDIRAQTDFVVDGIPYLIGHSI